MDIENEYKSIDDSLGKYYHNMGFEYNRDEDGNGMFLQWIIKEELLDDSLPIERELGDECDPNDCTYTSIQNGTDFPMPIKALSFTNEEKDAFIFFLLQYCWRHSQPPPNEYIQQNIIARIQPDVTFGMSSSC